MDRKLFTISEANRALPRLSRLMRTVQTRLSWLKERPHKTRFLLESHRIPDDSPVRPDYFRALIGIRAALAEVEAMGVQVKDVGSGLVDFPSRLHGRDILLCWKLGEDEVKFWHDLEAGYAGRQPLPDAGPSGEGGEEGH